MIVRATGTAAVILAAGASARLGEAKQLVTFQGERLLDRAVRIAREAGCEPVLVVLGAGADEIKAACRLAGALLTVNAAWQEGMASSVRAGVNLLPPTASGVIVMTCDQPAVTPAHLLVLRSVNDAEVVASGYDGIKGIPAYFPRSAFPQLAELRGDRGAHLLLRGALSVDLMDGDFEVDTPEDLVRLRTFGEG